MADKSFFIVGIGASTGGLEALKIIFASIKHDCENMAFVVAQHVSPTHKSMLVKLLQKETTLSVSEATHNQIIKPASIYITPPNHQVSVVNGKIRLAPLSKNVGPKPSINYLFESLSNEYKDRAIGLILSGTGSDGTDGAYHIKQKKGLVLAQNPESAKFDGMPKSVINAGYADLADVPSKLWGHINSYVESFQSKITYEPRPEEDEQIEVIYNLLLRRTGTDFTQYKNTTIFRRLKKRIAELDLKDLNEYLAYLEEQPKEIEKLYSTLLIGYTYFMRDKEAFKSLQKSIEKLLKNKLEGDSLRIWVPGCSTGEEAYSIAILLSEYFGDEINKRQVQIFATDIDEQSITKARNGVFEPRSLINLSKELIDKYFVESENQFEVRKELRSRILFSRHDLTKNPPFLRLDIVSCRNVLIYFNNELQSDIFPLFHHALCPKGILFLGKSETIKNQSNLFSTIDSKNRIYLKKFKPSAPKSTLVQYNTHNILSRNLQKKEPKVSLSDAVGYTLMKSLKHPFVIVNEQAEIIEVKGNTKSFLSLSEGEMNANLYKLVEMPLQFEVRNILNKAIKDQKKFVSNPKNIDILDHFIEIQITAEPLKGYDSSKNLYLVVFKTKNPKKKSTKKRSAKSSSLSKDKQIEELEKELDTAKEYLQNYIEELETSNEELGISNEELQSLNEELQSTNEELQSSNEEMENSNEELQSTTQEVQIAYEELKDINHQLEKKESALRQIEANLKGLLENTQQASVLMNHKSEMIEWNQTAAKLFKDWYKQPEKFSPVSIYLPDSLQSGFSVALKKTMKGSTVTGQWEYEYEGNRSFYLYNFTPIFDTNEKVKSVSLGLMDVTESEQMRAELHKNKELIDSVFANVNIGICLTDENDNLIRVNNEFCNIYGYTREELLGESITSVIMPESLEDAEKPDKFINNTDELPGEIKAIRKDKTTIDIQTSASKIQLHDGSIIKITTVKDITERKKYKALLEEAGHSAKVGGWSLNSVNNDLECTEEVYHIYGMDKDEDLDMKKALKAFPPDARKILKKALKRAQKDGLAYDLILPFNSKDGLKKWVRGTCKPIVNKGKVVKLLGTFQDVTNVRNAEDEVKKLSLVATKTDNSVVITDMDGKTEWVNQGFFRLTGYTLDEMLGKKPGDVLQGKDTDPLTVSKISGKLKEGESFSEKILNYKKNGEPYWLEMNISAIKDENGEIEKFISIQSDITDQVEMQNKLKASLYEKEVLLKEVHHRVKNNLAVISGLFYLEIENSKDESVKRLLLDSQSRINSIANVHELIYKNNSFVNIKLQDYLSDILKYLKSTFLNSSREIEISTDIENILLTIDIAVPVALLINELLVNIFKHAFVGRKKGKIELLIYSEGDEIDMRLKDDGVGFPENINPDTASSLGMMLVKNFASQIEGKSKWILEPDKGTEYQIRFSNTEKIRTNMADLIN